MISKVKPYPKQVLQLQTFTGFLAEFYNRLKTAENKTSEQIYEALESDYQTYFGKRKYSNYKSFRVIRAKNAKS